MKKRRGACGPTQGAPEMAGPDEHGAGTILSHTDRKEKDSVT
jgi:hypothetical protein